MIVYRMCKAAHVKLDGEGARLWGGRWNSPGRPVVYAGASPSLAMLEVIEQFDLPGDLLPHDLRMLTLEIPDDIPCQRLDVSPVGNEACMAAGDSFLNSGDALTLLVKSAVVPSEWPGWNVLLNVEHLDMARVAILSDDPIQLDAHIDDWDDQ